MTSTKVDTLWVAEIWRISDRVVNIFRRKITTILAQIGQNWHSFRLVGYAFPSHSNVSLQTFDNFWRNVVNASCFWFLKKPNVLNYSKETHYPFLLGVTIFFTNHCTSITSIFYAHPAPSNNDVSLCEWFYNRIAIQKFALPVNCLNTCIIMPRLVGELKWTFFFLLYSALNSLNIALNIEFNIVRIDYTLI